MYRLIDNFTYGVEGVDKLTRAFSRSQLSNVIANCGVVMDDLLSIMLTKNLNRVNVDNLKAVSQSSRSVSSEEEISVLSLYSYMYDFIDIPTDNFI